MRCKSTKKNAYIQKNEKKSAKNLRNSKKSSTFAPAFEKMSNVQCQMTNSQMRLRPQVAARTVVIAQLAEHRIVVPSVVGSLRQKL